MASAIANLGLGVRLEFSVPGVEALRTDVSRFANAISDYTPFWNGPFLEVWTPWIQEAFASEGASTGPRWAPLSPAYAAWKVRRGFSSAALVRTGDLSRSLLQPNVHALGVWRATPNALAVGTTRQAALFHQLGTRRMPARPPIRPTRDFMLQLGKALQKFTAKAWADRRSQQRQFSGS